MKELDLNSIQNFVQNDDAFILSYHARVRMFQGNISTEHIKQILQSAEIIEEYPDDAPCPSALLMAFSSGEVYHIVVGQCVDHLRIITIYKPDSEKWIDYKIS